MAGPHRRADSRDRRECTKCICAFACALGAPSRAAAQDSDSIESLTAERESPLLITGFGVVDARANGRTDENSFNAGKLAVSMFRELSDQFWVFGQLTTAVVSGEEGDQPADEATTEIEIDNLIVNFALPEWSAFSVAAGKFDTPLGFEPQVTLRSKADVIRSALPGAARYTATTVRLSRSQLQQIEARAHYTPNTDAVRFYKGVGASDQTLGTVVFPQVDTQHGPIEAGVAIGPGGAITSVAITRVTVEAKPWAAAVERSGVLARLEGTTAGQPPPSLSRDTLRGMPGYVADAVATAANRGLVLYDVLQP